MRRSALLLGLLPALCSLLGPGVLRAQVQFPHQRHATFFSDCSVCHGGISEPGGARFPEPGFCAACHDGSTAPAIDWAPPQPRTSNLKFDHGKHGFGCSTCHLPGGEENPAVMTLPQPATCLGCHVPGAEDHLAVEECAFCHVPVVESGLAQSRIQGFPRPPSHMAQDFAASHGRVASQGSESCATCHDRTSCTTCHGSGSQIPQAVLDLPSPRPDGPRGVQISEGSFSGYHPPGFATQHSAAASSGQVSCTTCHAENTCLDCHDGLGSPSFHPLNFLASHGPEAYGRVSDCTSCHNSEAFCRECHLGTGIRGDGGIVAPYHDNQALWVLSHPQAARQDLESCVSCHQQNDCLRCHSASVGLGVNPHGPDFDASAMQSRNRAMCELCHVPGSVGGNLPGA
jgi:predicted CXXCH cytochrome family protein